MSLEIPADMPICRSTPSLINKIYHEHVLMININGTFMVWYQYIFATAIFDMDTGTMLKFQQPCLAVLVSKKETNIYMYEQSIVLTFNTGKRMGA